MTDEAEPDLAIVVLATFPSEDLAADVARAVVGEQLAACASVVTRVRSIYRWQGAVHDETESLAIIKTTRDRLAALAARIAALHSYDVPEVVALPIVGGHPPYLAWLRDSVAAS
jgi:periplasmic divalent cation tolerance protein